jgi:hypothetical protein
MTDDQRQQHDPEDEDQHEDEEGAEPVITLDRYLSQRRPQRKAGVGTIVAMILMLVTLVLIVMYKDSCGAAVSGLMGDLEPPEQEKQPTVKVRLQQPTSQPATKSKAP